MAAEIIKNSIMSPPATGNMTKMTEYIDKQVNYIKSLEQLDLTPAQLATNVLLLKLPEDLANTIRNGLRLKRRAGGQEDFKFTPDEFRDVVNDTVMTWKVTAPKLAAATTVLQTSVHSSKETQEKKPLETKNVSQNDTTNGNTRGGARGGSRGNSRGTARGGFRSYYKPYCSVCEEAHYTTKCSAYPDSKSKRGKLSDRGRCQDCARAKHEGICKLRYKCSVCTGDHLNYLCPGVKQGGTA